MTIVAKGIAKAYDGAPLFQGLSLTINSNERLGIVGPNGVGKTTLLKCLCDAIRPDTGSVTITGEVGVSWQQPAAAITVLEYLSRTNGNVLALGDQLTALYDRMSSEGANDELSDAVAAVQLEFERRDGWTFLSSVEEVLTRLGLDPSLQSRTFGELSGGQASRSMLAAQLLAKPANLLLDEPTNNLDVDGLDWLSTYLNRFTGAVVIISHDREFLDATATNILELDGISAIPTLYPGNYTAFETQKQAALERLALDYKAQQKFVSRIEVEMATKREVARKLNTASLNDYYRSKAARVDRQWKAQRTRLEKLLHSVEAIAKPETRPVRPFALRSSKHAPMTVASISASSISYPGEICSTLENVHFAIRRSERVALTGKNGTGKSTVVRALVGDPSIEIDGLVNRCENFGYLEQSQATYSDSQRVIDFFRDGVIATEDEARSVLRWYGFAPTQVFHPLELLSPGERVRLVIAKIVYGGADLLILDEPTNHLDIEGMKQLETALIDYDGALLVVSHDRRFLRNIGINQELRIDGTGITPVVHRSRSLDSTASVGL